MARGPRARRCGRLDCPCTHELCDRGWIDSDERGTSTRPCLSCRQDLAVAIGETVDRDEFRRRMSEYRRDRWPLGATMR